MTQNNVVRVEVLDDKSWEDILVAELSSIGFHAFESEVQTLIGYIDEHLWTNQKRDNLVRFLQSRLDVVSIIEDIIPPQNWNELWEASIEPVEAGGFIILPSWKRTVPFSTALDSIYIDPKMSFGTGHHETTRLMLEMMSEVDFRNKAILDAGTGTGVLAIAARKIGAASVLGFDSDPWSASNARENLALNMIQGVTLLHGSLEDVPDRQFDIILANIVQNVIEGFLPGFARRLQPSGRLMVSGILASDEAKFRQTAAQQGFDTISTLQESEWLAFHMVPGR